jgi:hypothetical protein
MPQAAIQSDVTVWHNSPSDMPQAAIQSNVSVWHNSPLPFTKEPVQFFLSSNAHLQLMHLLPRAGIAQSVRRLATGWMVHGLNPGGGKIFPTFPDLL